MVANMNSRHKAGKFKIENLKLKTKIFGELLLMESLFMFVAMTVSLLWNEDDWRALFIGAFATGSVGGLMSYVGSQMPKNMLSRRDCYMVVALVWVVFSLFGMIPYLVYGTVDNIADAFFEAMSGFSTTGASILNNIDEQPHGILFWRSMTQWMGGLGIVVFSFALIPVYELKNTNMFSAEVTGISVDKLRPQIGATARRLLYIYIIMTVACTLCFWIGPMDLYDAICHSFATIATGGFSTHQASIAYFHSSYIEYTCSFFMLISGINFSLFYYASIGRWKILFSNEELRWYLGVVITLILTVFILFYYNEYIVCTSDAVLNTFPKKIEDNLRSAIFHVISIITSTGFQAQWCDYVGWGSSFWIPTMFLMVVGACAGSTGGGIKIIRFLVVFKNAINEFILQLHPQAILPVRLNGQVLSESKLHRALAFVLLYLSIMIIAVFLFSLTGLDLSTSIGSGVSMLSNCGPGMGTTGPTTNYADCLPAAKWMMSAMMLIGRLEIFTVLFLFMPEFWRKN